MRVLVAGGAGFVGRAFVAAATMGGAVCTSIGRARREQAAYRGIDLNLGSDDMAHWLDSERPNLVVDLSGTTSPGNDLFAANVTPTRNLLAAIDRVPGYDPRIVVVGSAAEYGDLGSAPIREDARAQPRSEYGIAKLARTDVALAARRRGRRVLVVRPFNVIGPGMAEHLAAARFALGAMEAIRNGSRELTVGDLSTVRDYLDVADVATALWELSTAEVPDEIVNICSGQPTRTAELLAEILRQLAISLEIRRDPKLIRGPYEVAVSLGNPSRLAAILGRRPSFDLARSIHGLIGSLS